MPKTNYILSGLVLAGLGLSTAVHAAVINWGANFTSDVLTVSANFADMFMTPLITIAGVLCAVLGIGAIIGYLKH